jgi:Bacterial regulatory proteins, luxR family
VALKGRSLAGKRPQVDGCLCEMAPARARQRSRSGELGLSDKTVDRQVRNIFTKLDVPSRAAATDCAYEHKLI